MNKRPKSREETPKEGSDSARRYRTATICDRDAQNARTFETFPTQSLPSRRICNRSVRFNFLDKYQSITRIVLTAQRYAHSPYTRTRDFVKAAIAGDSFHIEA